MLIPILPTTECVNFCFVMKEKKDKTYASYVNTVTKKQGSVTTVFII